MSDLRLQGIFDNPQMRFVPHDNFSRRVGRLYIIGSNELSAVKIGFTSGDVAKRLRDLQTGNPHHLRVLAEIPAVKADEREMHILLREDKIKGEWYDKSSVFVRVILAIANG